MLGSVEQEDKKKETKDYRILKPPNLSIYIGSIVFNGPNWKTKDYKIKIKYFIKLDMEMTRSKFHI